MTSRTQRDSGAELALNRAGDVWRELAEHFAYRYFLHVGDKGAMFEDAHEFAASCFRLKPPSPNAWGALALSMAKKGLIEHTGRYQRSVKFKNHARSAAVWRALTPL